MNKEMSKRKKTETFNFEKGLADLEKIVTQLEKGNTSLEVSLTQFAHAIELIQQCQTTLQQAEQRIEILVQKNQSSHLEPFNLNQVPREE
jgi:exodeoxyribonuclease VII small subunit